MSSSNKKMKGVALDPSSYGGFGDSKARIKHQTLLQDYQDLQKMNLGLDYTTVSTQIGEYEETIGTCFVLTEGDWRI